MMSVEVELQGMRNWGGNMRQKTKGFVHINETDISLHTTINPDLEIPTNRSPN